MFSYVVPDISRVCLPDVSVVLSRHFQSVEFCYLSCQMSVANVLSEYLLSCLRIFFVFHCTVRVPSFLSEDVTFFVFHCYESPDVLAKLHQSLLPGVS